MADNNTSKVPSPTLFEADRKRQLATLIALSSEVRVHDVRICDIIQQFPAETEMRQREIASFEALLTNRGR